MEDVPKECFWQKMLNGRWKSSTLDIYIHPFNHSTIRYASAHSKGY